MARSRPNRTAISKNKFFENTFVGANKTKLFGLKSAAKLEKNLTKVILEVDIEIGFFGYYEGAFYVKGHDFKEQLAIAITPLLINEERWLIVQGQPIDMLIIRRGKKYFLQLQGGHKPEAEIQRIRLYADDDAPDDDDGDPDEVFRDMGIIDEDGDYLHQE